VARVGGITPWLKVAHLAECCNLAVAPHFLMELHVSLTTAVPNGAWLEYIPQLFFRRHGQDGRRQGHAGMVGRLHALPGSRFRPAKEGEWWAGMEEVFHHD
jgi:L-alanine-DL-glutamate epimerase-like enolase superfamily enzyme